MTTDVSLAQRADPRQLRALVQLLLANDMARNGVIDLHHTPETLGRAPAKLEILVNAIVVFIERGFTDVTVQDLLDASRISRRTFYKYFRNKTDVLENLYMLAIDIMLVRFKGGIGSAASVEGVARHTVDAFFAYHGELAPVIRLMQEEAIRIESPLAPHRARAMATVATMVSEELHQLTGKAFDPLLIQSLMWAMESASIECLRDRNATSDDVGHARDVMNMIAVAALERAATA